MTLPVATRATRTAYLARQERRARDVSALIFEGRHSTSEASERERAYLAQRVTSFHGVLRRLHTLPRALRRSLLLFDEIEVRFLGDEHLVEPLPPANATRLDQWLIGGTRPTTAVFPHWLRLVEICVELNLHGIPPHLMLRPEAVYWTEDQFLLADLGLSILIPHFMRKSELTDSLIAYTAPEILGGHACARGDLADVHALGCIAAGLLLAPVHFEYLRALDGRDKYVLSVPAFEYVDLPPVVTGILKRMCAADPSRRPSLVESLIDLNNAWRPNRTVSVPPLGSLQQLERRVDDYVRAVASSPREQAHAAADVLVDADSLTDQNARTLLSRLAPVLRTFTTADGISAPLNDELAVAVQAATMMMATRPWSSISLLCTTLAGLALSHLLALNPLGAAQVLWQARSLHDGTAGPPDESRHLFLLALELGSALASGQARELQHLRDSAGQSLDGPVARAVIAIVCEIAVVVAGNSDTACRTLAESPREGMSSGLLDHLRAHLEVLVELEGLELGMSLRALDALVAEEHSKLPELLFREHALRVFPQIDRPAVLFLRAKVGKNAATKSRHGAFSAAYLWQRYVCRGLVWWRYSVRAVATTHFLRALPMLSADALPLHSIDLGIWLAEAHTGLSREILAAEYLAPAAARMQNLPFTPRQEQLSEALREGQHAFAGSGPGHAARFETRLESHFDYPDDDFARSARLVADWLMSKLMAEFHGMFASLTLHDRLGAPLIPGGTLPSAANEAYARYAVYASHAQVLATRQTSGDPSMDPPPLLDEARRVLGRIYDSGVKKPLARDVVFCHADARSEMRVELRFGGYLFRTFDETARVMLAERFKQLARAFIRFENWGEDSPPVPRQLDVTHLIVHEVKGPLVWLQHAITNMYNAGGLSLDIRRRLDGVIGVCNARLLAFCDMKLWDVDEIDLGGRIQEIVCAWRETLHALNMGVTVEFVPPASPGLRLRVRRLAVELIVSELIENARKHGREGGCVTVRLRTTPITPNAGYSAVSIKVENSLRERDEAPENSGQFVSTGLGRHLVQGLVDQLDGGELIPGVLRNEHGSAMRVVEMRFNAPLVRPWNEAPNQESSP